MLERAITVEDRRRFRLADFVVVPGIYDPAQADEALDQAVWTKLFAQPRPVRGSTALVAEAKSRQALAGTGLGQIVEAIALNGIDLEISLEEEFTVRHRTRQQGGPQTEVKDARLIAYELPNYSEADYGVGRWGAAAVTPLSGRLWVRSATGYNCELLEPGDVVFTGGETYYLEPFVGETSRVLVVAGERFAYELPQADGLEAGR